MKVQLKVRKEEIVGQLSYDVTFKIPESSFIFMRLDVSGLTIPAPLHEPEESDTVMEPITVTIPEGKLPVVCLSTGKTQWMNIREKVQIVVLEAKEIFREEE